VCIGLSVTIISARAYRERRGGVGGVDEVEAGDVNAAVTKVAQTQLVHLLRRRDTVHNVVFSEGRVVAVPLWGPIGAIGGRTFRWRASR